MCTCTLCLTTINIMKIEKIKFIKQIYEFSPFFFFTSIYKVHIKQVQIKKTYYPGIGMSNTLKTVIHNR